jgi:hypothetical protein
MDRIPTPPSTAELEQTVKVAKGFRGLLVYLGFFYLGYFVMMFLNDAAKGNADSAPLFALASLGVLGVAFVCYVIMLIQVYRCCSAMGSVGFLWVIAMFLPYLNLLTLLALNSRAKAFLEKRDVKIGFLGPNPDEILRLERSINGR